MTVKSLDPKALNELRMLIADMSAAGTAQHEIRESLVALGVSRQLIIRAVGARVDDENMPLKDVISDFRNGVERQSGAGSFDESHARSELHKMVQHEKDIRHFRKVAGTYKVDAFIINKLAEFQQKSPLDKGEGLIGELLLLAGLTLPEANSDADSSSQSENVERTRKSVQQQPSRDGRSFGQTLIDVCIGLGLGVGAILLLN